MDRDDRKDPNGIATRKELDKLIEDRRNDPPVPHLDHPKPSWMMDADDPVRRRIRMRERRIRYLENRLSGASRTMEREFDQNS